MSDMSLQERYDEVARLSGLSEEVIRRVYKATRQSIALSLKRGERATIPGICSITPELRNKIDREQCKVVTTIKIKAKASTALESELDRINSFEDKNNTEAESKEQEGLKNLTYMSSEEFSQFDKFGRNTSGVITKQINALL
jgi:nucleoid DNA-binding protein